MARPADDLVAKCREALRNARLSEEDEEIARAAMEYVVRSAGPVRDPDPIGRAVKAMVRLAPEPERIDKALAEYAFGQLNPAQQKLLYCLGDAGFHDRMPGAKPRRVRSRDIRGLKPADRRSLAAKLLALETPLGLVKHWRNTQYKDEQYAWEITPLGVEVRRLILWAHKGNAKNGRPNFA